jgi:hypothetical protein
MHRIIEAVATPAGLIPVQPKTAIRKSTPAPQPA